MGQYDFLIGAALALFASVGTNFGVNIQKLSFMKMEKRPKNKQRPYYSDPLWLMGLLHVIGGALGDFASLAFTGQAIVAQIGASTLVANIFFANCWLKEKLSKTDIIGTVLIIIGPSLSVGFGNHKDVNYTQDKLLQFFTTPLFIGYLVLLVLCVMVTYVFVKKVAEPKRKQLDESMRLWKEREKNMEAPPAAKDPQSPQAVRDPQATKDLQKDLMQSKMDYARFAKSHALAYCALSGMIGSSNMLFGKMVSELLAVSFSGNNQFVYVLSYVFLVCMLISIFAQLHFLAKALKSFDALYCIPVFQCFFISTSTICGACYFNEFSDFGVIQWVFFSVGLIITLVGVYCMSLRVNEGQKIEPIQTAQKEKEGEN